MSLRPFFTYYGGKWRIAPRYPAPAFDRIVEPFAGSAGYSLRHPEHSVVLYDLNEHVAGTWDYLINVSPDEIRALPLLSDDWNDVNELDLHQEARWLIGWWLNKGTARPSRTPSKWVRTATSAGENYWGAGVRERIASQVEYIRHWQIFHASYETAPNEAATWYVDPPYQKAGKAYPNRDVDFPALAQWCRTREGQVLVCENDGADWLPFKPLVKAKATAGARRSGYSKESLWDSTITATSNEL